ncbi:MAG: hypothetical protein WCE21_05310 [Candidatus Babeliales bacterium]
MKQMKIVLLLSGVCLVHDSLIAITHEDKGCEQSPLFEYVCPHYYLSQIEQLGLQLVEDLELMTKESNVAIERVLDGDYVLTTTEKLVTVTQRLIEDESKTYHYLPDDIQYLQLLIKQVEDKLLQTTPRSCVKGIVQLEQVCHHIATVQQLLDRFLQTNIECAQ